MTGILFWPSFHSETLICNGSCVVIGLAKLVGAEVRAGWAVREGSLGPNRRAGATGLGSYQMNQQIIELKGLPSSASIEVDGLPLPPPSGSSRGWEICA